MPTPQEIEQFTLAFHREVIARLRARPELLHAALATIDRWEARGVSAAGKRYRDEWRALLRGTIDELERQVCCNDEHAATLRGVSPLGFVLDDSERLRLRAKVMAHETR